MASESIRTLESVSDNHIRVIRRADVIGRGVLWGFAILTMGILVTIVGYIIWNGMVTRSVADYEVIPLVEEVPAIGEGADTPIRLIVNNRLRVGDIRYVELMQILNGDAANWGRSRIAPQNLAVSPIIFNGTPGFLDTVTQEFLGEESPLTDRALRESSVPEIIEYVSNNRGAIGIIPGLEGEVRGVKTIGLRRVSLVVNQDVLALQEGRRLRNLTMDQVDQVYRGEVTAWSQLGGPGVELTPPDPDTNQPGTYAALPPRIVVWEQSVPGRGDIVSQVFGEDFQVPGNAISVSSVEEFREAIRSTPGAIGLTWYPDTFDTQPEDAVLSRVPVERVTVSRNLRASFFVEEPSQAGRVGGISVVILNTLAMIALTLLIATPIGLSAAIYLVEYAHQGRLLTILRIGTDTLAGIPSIIFGLFGLVVFSQGLGLQTGLLSGTLTITLMVLPTIVRTSEEALKAVPRDLREGSLALGATKIQTIWKVVLPAASPGILTGVILAIGRAVGETAAILYTMGSNLSLLRSLNSPIRVMSVHLYFLIRENISIPNAFATATILVLIVFLVNQSTTRLIGRLNRQAGR